MQSSNNHLLLITTIQKTIIQDFTNESEIVEHYVE